MSVLSAAGALLAAALLVVPAATTRLWTQRMPAWQIATVVLVAVEGIAGLWLSVELNAPPGPAIAVLAGGVFAVAAAARALPRARRLAAAPAAAALLGLTVALTGCAQVGSSGDKPSVVATTTQIADFARNVGGNAVDVHQILQPNTDPHEYEPRPGDVTATAGAKLVLENGDNLDAWMGKVVE